MIDILTAAAMMVALPSPPADIIVTSQSAIQKVTVDGEQVHYRAANDADGKRHVWGERLSDGAEFHFRLDSHGRGRGEIGHKKVKFRVR